MLILFFPRFAVSSSMGIHQRSDLKKKLLACTILWRILRKRRRQRTLSQEKRRGSRPGRLWKKPSLPVGSTMRLYFHPDCAHDSLSSGDERGDAVLLLQSKDFRKQFRVSRGVFTKILRGIYPVLHSQHTKLAPSTRMPVSIREALAMTLTRLGSKGESFRVAQAYGRGHSTLRKWLDKVAAAIVETFGYMIALPDGDELRRLCRDMVIQRGFPMAWGARDGKVFKCRY